MQKDCTASHDICRVNNKNTSIMTAKNNREQIIALLRSAKSKVQISVSWLTDEILIGEMTKLAKKVKIKILLSCDPLNVFRYTQVRELQKNGAMVLKTGANFPGQKGFMHAQFMIIDETSVYGGSFNFTEAANFNFENFSKYSDETVAQFKNDFKEWFGGGKDYTIGFENPTALENLVKQQIEMTESFRRNLLATCAEEFKEFAQREITERENLIVAEIEKDYKRKRAGQLQNGTAAISREGAIVEDGSGVTSKPHKFYGGGLMKTKFQGQKQPGTFSFSYLQKMEIEKKFSFLKCRIENDTLICRGYIQFDSCSRYEIKIEYRAGTFPQVYILNPFVEPQNDIHIYGEGSLCLFYPGDMQWKGTTSIAEYTIPWIYEWILYYELYLLTGIWEGAYEPHGAVKAMAKAGKGKK